MDYCCAKNKFNLGVDVTQNDPLVAILDRCMTLVVTLRICIKQLLGDCCH